MAAIAPVATLFRPAICTAVILGALTGCAHEKREPKFAQPRVVVVAPVLNLSGSQDFDALRLTDLIASEFLSYENVAVIPVNRTLAELATRGRTTVESPAEAVELAQALDADATVVTAVTEYDPYDPPIVGMIMQWYPANPGGGTTDLNPVLASRMASNPQPQRSAEAAALPRWQVQRVFNAAREEIRREVQEYADRNEEHSSPYGWQRYTKSQELFLRYCGWALIRTMIELPEQQQSAAEPNEASS